MHRNVLLLPYASVCGDIKYLNHFRCGRVKVDLNKNIQKEKEEKRKRKKLKLFKIQYINIW